MSYPQYYATKLEGSRLYVDFVVDCAWTHLSHAICQYGSKLYQQTVGESRNGCEIKFDEQYAKTGNLWIEIAEKARPREGPYVPSGIFRQDNTWLYVIGDYNTIFFFAKTLLRALYHSGRWPVIQNRTSTSEGFLLRRFEAEKFAAVILYPNATEAVKKVAGDVAQLGRILHEAAKRDVNQLDLFKAKIAGDYNAEDDFARSIDDCYAAVRERKAQGGKGWPE
jgi:hypothetical protein